MCSLTRSLLGRDWVSSVGVGVDDLAAPYGSVPSVFAQSGYERGVKECMYESYRHYSPDNTSFVHLKSFS